MIPGPPRYAVSHVHKSAFELYMTPSVEKDILEMTNLEGSRVYVDSWKDVDVTDLHAYIG